MKDNVSVKDILDQALETNWTYTNDFDLTINNNMVKFKWSETEFGKIIQKCVMNIDLPPFTSPESDFVLGGERRIGTKIFEAFRFTIKFRDFEFGELRRFFEAIWIAQQYHYKEDIRTSVSVSKMIKERKVETFQTDEALITEVSNFNFDSTGSGIGEFTVSFISNKVSDKLVSRFGEHTFIENFDRNLKKKDPNKIKDI